MQQAIGAAHRETIPVVGGRLEMIVYSDLPHHDSTWGLTTEKDGRLYIGACGESFGGLSVFLLRYHPETDELEYLVECGPAVGEPPDNGHATQSKIHYCLLPGDDGKLYCATHASGPPWGDPSWNPWACWDDTVKRFPGSHLFIYDPKTNGIEDLGVGPKKEGSRALAFDEKRQKLYGITWPRNHFYIYDLAKREYTDLGRFGEINPQAVWLDRDGNVYTTDDYGFLLKHTPGSDDLVRLHSQAPHLAHRRGFHNVPYDVVPSPDWSCVYGTDWGYESYLWKFDPHAGPEGSLQSYGRAWGPPDFPTDSSLEATQVRGLVFGADGKLYFTMTASWETPRVKYLLRFDPKTQEREVLGPIKFGDHQPGAIASATQDYYGNLYFAGAGNSPTRMYVYRPDGVTTSKKRFRWKDIKQWG